ncbi:MAG: peptidylprolyl isomerase [Nitrospirota bacterium]
MILRILICLLIPLTLLISPEAAVLLDRIVAVVNKEVITWSELYKMMEYEATGRLKALSDDERMKVFKENESLFLEQIIDMRLQIQEAKRLGYEVTPEEIQEAMEKIKKKHSLTDSTLEESLNREGLTIEEYKKRLADQILVSKFVHRQIKNKIVISDEEVRKYIKKNKENLSEEETIRIRQIYFRRPKNEEDRKAVEERAFPVIRRLQQGEDFSMLAREYSEDSSARMDGDLGYVKKSLLAKKFVDVLSEMNVGDISQPFWTEQGLHIIKLEDKVSAKNVDEIEKNIKDQLAEVQFEEKYKDYIKTLRERARIEIRL